MKKKRNKILFFIFFFSFNCFSQENDFQTWFSFSCNKKVFKKTTLHFKNSLRLRENSSIYSKQFNDLKIKRKYNKRIAYALGYRFINRKDGELNFSNQNRFYSDLSYRKKIIKRLSFSLRNRLQLQGYLNSYSNTFRQKFALSYNIRKTKLTPNIATEYFIDSDVILNKLRSTVSLEYPLAKDFNFELAYRLQQEFNVNNPNTLFILETKVSYDF